MFSSQIFIKSVLFKINKVNVIQRASKIKLAKLKRHEHDLNLRNEYKLHIDAVLREFLADSSQKGNPSVDFFYLHLINHVFLI